MITTIILSCLLSLVSCQSNGYSFNQTLAVQAQLPPAMRVNTIDAMFSPRLNTRQDQCENAGYEPCAGIYPPALHTLHIGLNISRNRL